MGFPQLPLVPAHSYCPMDIRFWLRRAKKPGQAGTVYCTLTRNGVASKPFTTGILAWPPSGPKATRPRQWQLAPVQRLYGTAPDVRADNDTLSALYAKITSIYNELLAGGLPASPQSVVAALRNHGKALPSLAEAAVFFLDAVRLRIRPADAPAWDKSGYGPATPDKYAGRMQLLYEYLRSIRNPDMPLGSFTAKHADGLLHLLQHRNAAPGRVAGRKRGQCGAEYAGKVVGLVSQVLDYAVNQEWLSHNPLASYKAPRGAEKPLVYLWPEQVSQLESHAFSSPYLQRCADSFLFSCWTGLAWSDLGRFDATQHVDAVGWLEMVRQKTGVPFGMTLLPGAQRLLRKYEGAPGGLPRYENQPLNRALKEIASVLGWEIDLTHHAARRTFGMFLLNEDVPLSTVAALLGHRNERTTTRYYARFIEKRKVQRDMLALQQRLNNNLDQNAA